MRVLVIRAEPAASRTAARLTAAGHEPVVLPLARIAPIDARIINHRDFDAVAVTSANAARLCSRAMLTDISHLPCFAVGDETANVAREAGFTDVTSAQGDACALAALITRSMPSRSRILYLCGKLRRDTFERLLRDDGFDVTPIEVYDTVEVTYGLDELAARLGGEPIDGILVHSLETARSLMQLLEKDGSTLMSQDTPLICISSRVGALFGKNFAETHVAREPTEASMLSTLRDISSAEP